MPPPRSSFVEVDKKATGVYLITNTRNGKIYVGSASGSIVQRWFLHLHGLRNNTHGNRYLQNAWNKYGPTSFEFSVLEYCPPEKCVEIEQYWLDVLAPCDSSIGYNLYPEARSPLGLKRPPHVGEAVAKANRARVVSEETRAKMSKARKGKPTCMESQGAKNGRAKLDDEKVRRIRRLFRTGRYTKVALGKMFGVGSTIIYQIVIGRRWSHVD